MKPINVQSIIIDVNVEHLLPYVFSAMSSNRRAWVAAATLVIQNPLHAEISPANVIMKAAGKGPFL